MRSAGFIEFVNVFHQCSDGGVELVVVNVFCNFLSCSVTNSDILLLSRPASLAPVVTGLARYLAPVVANGLERRRTVAIWTE